MVQDQTLQRGKSTLRSRANRCQDLQHLVGVSQAAAGSKAKRIRADKQQVEEGFLSLKRAGKRSGNGNGLLKYHTMRMVSECVQYERVSDKELILEFLDDRFACFGPTAPMDMAERIDRK